MKYCKVCLQEFESDLTVCPNDGNPLVVFQDEKTLTQGRIIDGRYRIMDEIGQGGFGSIYTAYQFSMDRVVAVKVLSRSLSSNKSVVQRFIRESKALAKLSHPNIITVFESGSTDDSLMYIVMEYLKGLPLDRVINGQPVPSKILLEIAVQICDALIEAHSKGIIHRDLKPSNIFVEKKGGVGNVVKVLDFGIAKIIAGGDSLDSILTVTGFTFGTPEYMSPEQALGKKEIDHRADLYSLGIILYEMVTGSRPFSGATPLEVLNKQIAEMPRQKKEVNQHWMKIILHCLEKSPNKRPQSVQELKDLLLKLQQAIAQKGDMASVTEAANAPTAGRLQAYPGLKEKEGLERAPTSNYEAETSIPSYQDIALSRMGLNSPEKEISISPESMAEQSPFAAGAQSPPSPYYPGPPSQPSAQSDYYAYPGQEAQYQGPPAPYPMAPLNQAAANSWGNAPYSGISTPIPPLKNKGRRLLIPFLIGGGLILVVALGLILNFEAISRFVFKSQVRSLAVKKKPPSPLKKEPIQRPAKPIQVQIASIPAGAEVYDAKEMKLLGETDLKLTLSPETQSISLVFKKEGFADKAGQFDIKGAQTRISVRLKKKAAEQVEVWFKSIPAGANVYQEDSNTLWGKTDFKKAFQKSSTVVPLVFKLAGYKDQKVSLDCQNLKESIEVKLVPFATIYKPVIASPPATQDTKPVPVEKKGPDKPPKVDVDTKL